MIVAAVGGLSAREVEVGVGVETTAGGVAGAVLLALTEAMTGADVTMMTGGSLGGEAGTGAGATAVGWTLVAVGVTPSAESSVTI